MPGALPAVKRPVLLIEPAAEVTTDQVKVAGTVKPLASLPVAVNWRVPLIASVALVGSRVMLATGAWLTVMVAVPETAPLVARTVTEPGVLPAV